MAYCCGTRGVLKHLFFILYFSDHIDGMPIIVKMVSIVSISSVDSPLPEKKNKINSTKYFFCHQPMIKLDF